MRRHAYWIATLVFGVLVWAKFDSKTGLTSLIRFGDAWQDRRLSVLQGLPLATVRASNGYDGQFYAQLALDPLLRSSELDRVIDAPAYRARRILAPAVAAVLGWGRPWRVLQAYALLNVACWLALAWLLRRLTQSDGWVGFARWAGCMFSMGVLDSVRQSLVDLPAFLALAGATLLWTESGSAKPALLLALGNLTKETNLLGTLALHASGLSDRTHRKRSLILLILAALPIGLWSLYVQHRFGGDTAGTGLGNFTWPLLGLIGQARQCLVELLQGNFDGRYAFGLLAIVGLLAQAAVIWRRPDFGNTWWRLGAAYAVLLPFLGLWVWSGYWAACRAVLPLTVAFNLLLPVNRSFWPLWALGNLTLVHALWRFL